MVKIHLNWGLLFPIFQYFQAIEAIICLSSIGNEYEGHLMKYSEDDTIMRATAVIFETPTEISVEDDAQRCSGFSSFSSHWCSLLWFLVQIFASNISNKSNTKSSTNGTERYLPVKKVNSYWTWPISSGFTHENGAFPWPFANAYQRVALGEGL